MSRSELTSCELQSIPVCYIPSISIIGATSIDTYYLFRRRNCEQEQNNGVDLMQKCFEQVAGERVRLLKISGNCVRVDSKLIGSNIACQSRYELIHTTLVKFLKANNLSCLSAELQEQAKAYLGEDSSKMVYRSDADTLQSRLSQIGGFIMEVLAAYSDTVSFHCLQKRLFDEQYTVEDGKAVLRYKKTIRANSLQNPNDLDASYHDKHGQKVQGYVANLGEDYHVRLNLYCGIRPRFPTIKISMVLSFLEKN